MSERDIERIAREYNEKGVDIADKGAQVASEREAVALGQAELDDERAEAEEEMRRINAVARLGAEASRNIQVAMEKGDHAGMKKVADKMINDAIMEGATQEEAVKALRSQLQEYHDTFMVAAETGMPNMKEKAAEIDAFSRSLEQSETVGTDAGKAFIAKLESGKIGSMEEAMSALEQVKTDALAAGVSEETLNAEFNQLYKAASAKFEGGSNDKLDFDDSDMDNLFDQTGT